MKKVQFIVKTGGEHIMIHWPNGTVEFLEWIAAIKLAWWILRNGSDVEVVDGDEKEQT